MQPDARASVKLPVSDDAVVACVHARECGGCPLIDRPYGAQRAFKRERVREAFARFTALSSVSVRDTEGAAAAEGYRTRAKFAVGASGAIGLYGEGHSVSDLPGCRVITERTREALVSLRALVREDRGGWALRARADGGALRAVDVRTLHDPRARGRESLQITLVLERGRANRDEARVACEQLVSRGIAESAAASWHDGRSPQLLGLEAEVLAGERGSRDLVGEETVWQHAAPGAFTQAHRDTAAAIHRWAREQLGALVGKGEVARVLELYAGAGALGLALAREGAEVTLVESYALGADAARSAAAAQGLAFVRVFAEDAARFARAEAKRIRAAREDDPRAGYDLVLLNPPRRGVDATVLEAIAELSPRAVLYVSCDPETLARDLSTLAAEGFAVEEARPFDMIPLTEEVETVAIARRVKRPSPTVVHRDERMIVCDGASGIRARALSWARARVEGFRSAVAVAGADEDESGLVVIARSPEDAAELARTGVISSVECEAWVKSVLRDKGAINRPVLGVADARTRYHRKAVVGGHSLARLKLEAGTTRTARAHLASIDHPVLGDRALGERGTNTFLREKMALDRVALHVSAVTVSSRAGDALALRAEPVGDLALLSARLERRSLGSRADLG
jgi:23S rRNA (uracil1939-C5)-methyltransferase